MRPPPLRALALLLLHLASAAAAPLLAQAASGALYGVVRDQRGVALPGAKVTVRGEQGEARFQDTSSSGEFRFLGLEPALYHAQVTLDGYSSAEYPDLPIHLGRSTSIEVTLASSDSGAIMVTAECPLLDQRRISTGGYVTREELEKMPGAREPWSLLEQAPGVLLDRVDVAGLDGVFPMVARAAGSGIDQNTYTLDGVVITDPQSLDTTPPFYDFASFEEAQVITGGTDVRVAAPGAALNLVTRRATNTWRADARYLLTDGDLQSDPEDVDLAHTQRFFSPSPSLGAVREYGADGGGPLLRDRAWIWAGWNRAAIDVDFAPSPPLFDEGAGDREAENMAIKVDVASFPQNRFRGFVYANRSKVDRVGGGPARPPATTLDLDAPTDVYKLEDSHVFGPTLFVEGHLSRVDGDVEYAPRGGPVEPTVDPAGVFQGGYQASSSDRRRDQARLEVSGFFGSGAESHEMKVGFGRRRAEVRTHERWGADDSVFVEDATGSGISTRVFFQTAAPQITLDTRSVYAQDTVAIGDLIADIGLRYDSQQGERGAAPLAPSALRPDLLPAATLPGTGGAHEWESLAPRVGLTWGFGEKHSTLLRASWSRFADQMGTAMFGDVIAGPELSPFSFAALRFFDRDDNRIADAGETQSTVLGALGGTVLDPRLAAPTTDEVLLGAEHAGVGCFSLGGRIIYRHYRDLLDARPFVRDAAGNVRVATSADYVPDTVVSGTLPRGTPYAVPAFALNPSLELLGTRRLANGDREVDYRGASVWLERRLRNRWEFRAYGTYRDETADVEPEMFALEDPTDALGFDDNDGAAYAPRSVFPDQSSVYLNSRWDYTVAWLYRARAGVGLAFLAHGREGYPLLYFERVNGSDGQTRNVAVTDEDSPLRLDAVNVLDLRAEKLVRLGGGPTSLLLSFDVLNLLNLTPPLERGTELGTPTADYVREIVAPRILRVGIRVELR